MVTVMPPFLLLGLCQTRLPRLIFFFLCADYSSDVDGLDYRTCRSSTRTAIRSVGQQLCLRRH